MGRLLIIVAIMTLAGCGTSGIKFDEAGNMIELKGDAANLYMAKGIEEQRTKTIEAMSWLEPNTQLVMGARDATSRNDPVKDMYAHKTERNKNIKDGLIVGSTIYGTLRLINGALNAPQGDTYGNVSVTQSNDPSGSFGEGGGTVSASNSPNYVMIGRNKAASGNGAVDVERFYPNNNGDNDNIQDNGKILPW